MKRIRIERRKATGRDDRNPVLPLDPRDPDLLRAKRALPSQLDRRSR